MHNLVEHETLALFLTQREKCGIHSRYNIPQSLPQYQNIQFSEFMISFDIFSSEKDF